MLGDVGFTFLWIYCAFEWNAYIKFSLSVIDHMAGLTGQAAVWGLNWSVCDVTRQRSLRDIIL